MSMAYWQGLTANLAIVFIAVLAWAHVEEFLPAERRFARTLAASLVASLAVTALMLMPVMPKPGLFFDLRVALISVFGVYVGIVPAALAGLTALCLRLLHGGAGVPAGVASILLALAIGIAGRWLKRQPSVAPVNLASLAAAAGSANVLCLLALPRGVFHTAVTGIGLPAFVMTCIAVLFAGLLLSSERRRRENARVSARFRAVVEALPDCLDVRDRAGRFVAANSAAAKLMGARSADSLIGRTQFDFLPPDTAERFRSEDEKAWRSGATTTLEQSLGDGSATVALMTLKAPLRDAGGEMTGLITHSRDVSAQRRLQAELDETHRRLGIALDNMADGLVQFRANGDIVFCNQRYRDLFPKTAHLRVPGANIGEIIRASVELGEEIVGDVADLERLLDHDSARVRREGSNIICLEGDRWIETRTTLLDDGGSLSVLSDVSERIRTQRSLEEANRQLAAQATTDGLTAIANRRYFDDRLGREFARAALERGRLSVILLDVDHFKDFNDRYGHLAGDDCLRLVSRALKHALKFTGATVARFGGEEFVALLPDTEEIATAALAEALRAAIEAEARPHAGSSTGVVTVSAGVFCGRPGFDVMTGEQMLSLADAALYRAKSGGRNRVELHPATSTDIAVSALRSIRR